uniref:7-deoxyloganetin glucosyltransferase-like n=1 Tax=Tanacetum cinerariifolium TaxID=118510 RepID=A0A6L2NKX7_TANCI|nr:7-deoxyloganetin glucosyltransferase-like [Tanacetum cinerariifolium]
MKISNGLPSFRFETIPDGLPPPENKDASQHVATTFKSLHETALGPLKSVLAKVSASYSPVTCMVADFLMYFALKASKELRIPGVLFWTAGGGPLICYDEYRNLIQKGLMPLKVNVFIWKLRLDKLPTLANMDKKGIDVASLLCPVCNAHVENVDHLFFSCGMAQDLWGLLARWCTLDIPEVSNIVEWFSWLDATYVSKHARTILEGIASTMLWSILNFRNAWIFFDD